MGRSSSQRARIAFCWLPPDSSPIGWRSEARRMRSFFTDSSASAFSSARRMKPPGAIFPERRR